MIEDDGMLAVDGVVGEVWHGMLAGMDGIHCDIEPEPQQAGVYFCWACQRLVGELFAVCWVFDEAECPNQWRGCELSDGGGDVVGRGGLLVVVDDDGHASMDGMYSTYRRT